MTFHFDMSAVQAQFDAGHSVIDLAEKFGCSAPTMRKHLLVHGMVPENREGHTRASRSVPAVVEAYQGGDTCEQLGEAYKCHESHIRNLLIEAGVTLRRPWEDREGPDGLSKLTPEQDAELMTKYAGGTGLAELAEEYKVAPLTVSRRLRKLGVVIRPSGSPVTACDGTWMLCSKCGETKLMAEFYKSENRINGYSTRCKACSDEMQRDRTYSLPSGWYKQTLAAQGGRCAGCGNTADHPRNGGKRTLSVDHCHVRLVPRWLLCKTCNHMVGSDRLAGQVLRRLADLLDAFEASHPIPNEATLAD